MIHEAKAIRIAALFDEARGICPRCEEKILPDEGTRILNGPYVHERCRKATEHLEQMIGCRLEDAPKNIEDIEG